MQMNIEALSPTIGKLLKIAPTLGASVGAVYKGELVYTENFGVRDHAGKHAVDSDTLYNLTGVSNIHTANLAGVLVERGDISWDTRVRDVIPEFQPVDKEVLAENCTLLDLLSHRTGLSGWNPLWSLSGPDCATEIDALIPIINALPAVKGFREGYTYSNMTYTLAAEMMTRCNKEKQPWHVLMKKLIYEPLEMKRTTTDANWREDENSSDSSAALPDGKVLCAMTLNLHHDTLPGGAMAVKSSMNELLIYYKEILRAYRHQRENNVDSTPNSPFKCMRTIFKDHTKKTENSSSCCGRSRRTIPKPNAEGSQDVYSFFGDCFGFNTCVMLIPDCDACIITLVNTSAVASPVRSINQLILDTILDSPEKTDVIKSLEAKVEAAKKRYPDLLAKLERERIPGTQPRKLDEYCGKYYWLRDWFFIDIICTPEGELAMVVQGKKENTFVLTHYHNDTFTWHIPEEEEAERGIFTTPLLTHFIEFRMDGEKKTLIWPRFDGTELVMKVE